MERRSAKRITPRKTYTVDAFEGIEELQDAHSGGSISEGHADEDESPIDLADGAEASADEQEMSEVEPYVDEVESNSESDTGERLIDENMSIAEDPNESQRKPPILPYSSKRKAMKDQPEAVKTYSRGVLENVDNKSSKADRQLYDFGPRASDYEPIYKARAKWASDPTLPRRSQDKHGSSGMHRSFYADDAILSEEAKRWRSWWNDEGGRSAFSERQILKNVDDPLKAQYMREAQLSATSFAMGPFKKQRLFKIPTGGRVPLSQAWESESHTHESPQTSLPAEYKKGFMLNLGGKIQCLEWASNQNGREQYLVASAVPRRETSHPPFEAPEAPAFTSQPAYGANVQIWAFRRNEKDSIDTKTPPRLRVVLCTDWGDAKDLKWCPGICEHVDYSYESTVGLLAGIWSDGAMRVLHVTDEPEINSTYYRQVKRVAFESKPPNTLYTCLAWLGPSRIVAGCANGCIAVWDLQNAVKSGSSNARPVIYSSICSSYILCIASCSHSRPNLLLTTTMDGFIALTDLSSSGQSLCSPANTVFSSRTRIAEPRLAWYDFGQTVLHIDDNFTLLGSKIRRLFRTVGLGRCRSNITCLAVSQCHPFVLVGTAHGDVISTNPIRRVLEAKKVIWEQIWFAHEWKRPTESENQHDDSSGSSADIGNGATSTSSNNAESTQKGFQTGVDGLSRISEGFKAERVAILDNESHLYNNRDGTLFTTIYEEKSAVTALAWNPNHHVGGWAAAGMGDGLVRVEDVAS